MNRIKLLLISLLFVFLAGCNSTPIMEEGGIGGTGHAKECEENNEGCNDQ